MSGLDPFEQAWLEEKQKNEGNAKTAKSLIKVGSLMWWSALSIVALVPMESTLWRVAFVVLLLVANAIIALHLAIIRWSIRHVEIIWLSHRNNEIKDRQHKEARR